MVNLGIIGAGRIGKLHAQNISQFHDVTIKTISDVYTEGLQEWASTLGIKNTTDDYTQIIKDEEIDAILICSSTNTHPNIITEAAKAGKHIFCEKPVSFELNETLKALKSVKDSNVKLQVGFVRRFDSHFKKVKEGVIEGSIGDPHIVKITSRDPNPPSKEYLAACGGIFLDQAIHDFDMARYLCGSDVVEVHAFGAILVDPMFEELNDLDTVITSLKFENGAIGVIDNSRKAVYGYDQRVEVFGSEGCLTVDNVVETLAKLSTKEAVISEKPKYFFLERYNNAFISEIREFIDCISNDRNIKVDGNDGLQAELIAHAAKKSFLEKRPVRIKELIQN